MVAQRAQHTQQTRSEIYTQCLSNRTPWTEKVPLAKKDCIVSFWAPLNDQYTDGNIWSIDDKEWVPWKKKKKKKQKKKNERHKAIINLRESRRFSVGLN